MTDNLTRWAWARVDLDAYAHNVAVLKRMVAPSGLWAVVKADAYGHGAVPVSRAAVSAGVDGLCVAITAEGIDLRETGIDAPILIFSEQPVEEIGDIVRHRLTATVYRREYVQALASAARRNGGMRVDVHVKVDTGMHRVGADPADVAALIATIGDNVDALRLAGIYTHFAAADVPGHPANAVQSQRFAAVLDALGPIDASVAVHAVNSAGAMSMPTERRDFVRAGIATYGIIPGDGVVEHCGELRQVMSLHARVSRVQRLAAGEGVSYGHRFVAASPTTVATLPIGYADGVPRRLWSQGGEVLIRGKRRSIIGVVTMDQLMVDCGNDEVDIGDEAVLFGTQGSACIRSEDWARALDTIGYEITCGIGPRVPRLYSRSV
ncbi:MAG: alanine racemase [Actinomycetota bacterium]